MAHGIIKPYDRIFSIESTEWHGLAEKVEAIGREQVNPLLFNIIESPALVNVDGQQVSLDNYKVLVADHRSCRPDLDPSQALVPLHIPKAGYQVIDNREVFEMVNKSLKDLDCKITSIGTLEGGKKFFVSVDIGGKDMTIKGDKFKAFLNFITSHDGTIAQEVYDSILRIVCMNTFMWSREAAGEVGFKVYHTKNANLAMTNLPDLLNAILKGRVEMVQVMEFLASCKIDQNDALAMATGYFCCSTGKVELSTRCHNAAQEIVTLFARGKGNRGENLYDLCNGATEYWTSGDGAGKSLDVASRAYRSNMGAAAEHKRAFIALLADEDKRKDALSMGRESLKALALSKN